MKKMFLAVAVMGSIFATSTAFAATPVIIHGPHKVADFYQSVMPSFFLDFFMITAA